MSLAAAILIFVFAFASSFIQRVTGFGFGILFMTVAPHIMNSYGEATALSGTLAIVCALVIGLRYLKYVSWKKLTVILITFIIVSFFAVHAVSIIEGRVLKHILGATLILIGIYFFLLDGKIRMKPSTAVQISMGTLSGAMGGLFGMQGPPAVIYFISSSDSKEEYMALAQWYFIIGNAMMTLYRAGKGFVSAEVGKGWLIGATAVLLGIFVGKKVYRLMPLNVLRKTVYIFLCISGVAAILS